ncbi:hypothetical protein O3P69_017356, partial [Scylla paramamosain]
TQDWNKQIDTIRHCSNAFINADLLVGMILVHLPCCPHFPVPSQKSPDTPRCLCPQGWPSLSRQKQSLSFENDHRRVQQTGSLS